MEVLGRYFDQQDHVGILRESPAGALKDLQLEALDIELDERDLTGWHVAELIIQCHELYALYAGPSRARRRGAHPVVAPIVGIDGQRASTALGADSGVHALEVVRAVQIFVSEQQLEVARFRF